MSEEIEKDIQVCLGVAARFTEVPVTAAGPTGEPVATVYARSGSLAVIARQIFERVALADDLVDFLTLAACDAIVDS